MAMERYNPTARASSRQMPSNGATPGNLGQGDPVNGYPFGSTTPGYIDYRNPADNGDFYEGTKRQQYRDDPNARLLHSPGSSRAEQSGWWETSGKNLSDIHEPFSWTAADEARDQAEQAQRRAADDAGWRARGFSGSDWWQSDPEYQQFLASGNKRGASRRKNDLLTEAKRKIQRDSFIAQGGRGETWDHRFSNENNWPRPTSSIGYSHGPGRPDYATRGTNPSPYGPGNTAPPMQGGAPPAASTGRAEAMGPQHGLNSPASGGGMPGGRYGGPGVTSGPGGWGSAGGYNPGASLQGPSSLGMGGSMSPQMQQMLIASEQARGFGGGSPFGGGFGGGMPGGRYGGPGQMGGGPVQGGAFMPGLFGGGMSPGRFFGNGGGMDGNPFMMGRGPGGSLGGMSAFGYNPGAQFNPFMMY